MLFFPWCFGVNAVHAKAPLVFYQRVRNWPLLLGICVAGGTKYSTKAATLAGVRVVLSDAAWLISCSSLQKMRCKRMP
jgi:hypothetical protein